MSLRGDKYETAEEIQFRLSNTVVLYDDKPVYITKTGLAEAADGKEIARVYFVELPYGGKVMNDWGEPVPVKNETRKFLSSKKFDLAPFKMGYFNDGGSATFVSRNPIRQNRQGLSKETAVFTDIRGKRSETMSFAKAVASQGFVDMISGVFPDFKEAGDFIKDGNDSVAVSRQFAFHIDQDLEALFLMHKGVKCGLAIRGDRHVRMSKKYYFLKQEAEECRIPLA